MTLRAAVARSYPILRRGPGRRRVLSRRQAGFVDVLGGVLSYELGAWSAHGYPRRYRRHAAAAQKEADRARNDLDREAWLRVAQGWLSLLTKPARTAEEAFDQSATVKGTGQDESKSSH